MLLTWQQPAEPAAPRGASRSHGGLGKVLGAHRAEGVGDGVSRGKSRQGLELNRGRLGPVCCSAIAVGPLLFPVVPFEIPLAWELVCS